MAANPETGSVDPEPDAGHTLRQYAVAVWKRRAWIALLLVLGVAGGWLKGRSSPDVYAVRTEIDITKQRPFGISPLGGNQVVSFGEGYLESQLRYPTLYKLLASGRYIESLLESATEPDGTVTFPMWDWLTWPAYAADPPSKTEPERSARLEARFGPSVAGPEAFEQLVSVSAAAFRARFAFRSYGPAAARSAASPYASPADLRASLEGHVNVEPVKGTALVDVELDGERKDVLAPLLNLLIETFSREQRTEGQKRLALESRLLDKEREGLAGPAPDAKGAASPDAAGDPAEPRSGSLGQARARLARWIAENGRTANALELRRKVLATQVEEGEKEIRLVSDRLATQRSDLAALLGDFVPDDATPAGDRAAAAALRERMAAITRLDATTKDSPWHRLPFVLADREVAALKVKAEGARASGATIGASQSDLNIAVAQVALRKALALATDLDVRAARRVQYERDVEELGTSWKLASDLAGLQAEVDRRTKELEALDARRDTIRTQETVESGLLPLRVIEPATDPGRPVRPNRLLLLLVGAGVGLLFGLALALLLEWLDDSVSDPVDVERYLHAPVLGTIVGLGSRDGGAVQIDRIASKLPRSPVSEAFRAVRTSVEFLGADADAQVGRVLVVSSCSPREGKTTVASNLAAVLAQDGKRTLLVDADMRRPRVHSVFGIENAVGLSNVIAGKARLEEAVVGTDQENLWVLPSGATPPNPAELLGRKSSLALFERLGREFDRVVVDTPPIGVVTDAAVLGRIASQVLMVVAAGRTKKRAAEHGEGLLRSAGAAPTGVILNQVSRGSRFLYGGYYHKDAAAYYGAADDTRP